MLTSDQVRRVQLPKVKLGRGYEIAEVDAFLELVAATLRHLESGVMPPQSVLSAADVEAKLFTTTALREGYSEEGVDALLDQVIEAIQAHTASAGEGGASVTHSHHDGSPVAAHPDGDAPATGLTVNDVVHRLQSLQALQPAASFKLPLQVRCADGRTVGIAGVKSTEAGLVMVLADA